MGDVIEVNGVRITVTQVDPESGSVAGRVEGTRPGDPGHIRQFNAVDLSRSNFTPPSQIEPGTGRGGGSQFQLLEREGVAQAAAEIAANVRNKRMNRDAALDALTLMTVSGTREAAEAWLNNALGTTDRGSIFGDGMGADGAGGFGDGTISSLPGFGSAFEDFLRQEQQIQAVGPRGVFRQMTEPFTRGLSPIGREAVENRFDPLINSFVTDPARINEIRSGRQPTLQEIIGGAGLSGSGGQIANPQEIVRRLVDIGGMLGTTDPAEQTFVDPFRSTDVTQPIFTQAATRQLNPFFRGAGRNVLGREIESILFDQPEDPLIAEIARRRGRLF